MARAHLPTLPAHSLPVIGITTGDPAGIGPEVSLKAASDPALRGVCKLLLFGDEEVLRDRARLLELPWLLEVLSPGDLGMAARELPERGIVRVPATREQIRTGEGSRASGEAAARNIIECVAACARGWLQAVVTGPLNKRFLQMAGHPFPGHTEFLAHLAGAKRVAMAFLTDRLKVVLATTHVPLREVADRITEDLICEKLQIIVEAFPRLGLPCRRIAVAGLNPHAGEGGIMGLEEERKIEPAIRRTSSGHPGVEITGPLPGDTVFHRAEQGEFDVVLAMYHDQGLAPVKLLGFGAAVNATLGLPFVRTSVDHGTAYDIAGRGTARADGLVAAVRWALRLAKASEL